jgi:hypothetical protein
MGMCSPSRVIYVHHGRHVALTPSASCLRKCINIASLAGRDTARCRAGRQAQELQGDQDFCPVPQKRYAPPATGPALLSGCLRLQYNCLCLDDAGTRSFSLQFWCGVRAAVLVWFRATVSTHWLGTQSRLVVLQSGDHLVSWRQWTLPSRGLSEFMEGGRHDHRQRQRVVRPCLLVVVLLSVS